MRTNQMLLAAGLVLSAAIQLQAQTARFTGVQKKIATGFTTYGGMAVDSQGDIFVADEQNDLIIEIGHTILPVGGTPEYLSLDRAGNLYVVTTEPATLQMFPLISNGLYGAPVTISTGFQNPWGVAVDSSGNIYVSDHTANEIYKLAPTNGYYVQSTYYSGVNQPAGMAIDSNNNLYVADRGNSRILELTSSGGKVTGQPIVTGLEAPSDVAVDSAGNLYIAGSAGLLYVRAVGGGTYTGYLLATNFGNPTGVALDASGAIYVSDIDTQFLVKQTLTANFGSVEIGATSSAQTLVFVFDSAATLNASAPAEMLTMGGAGLDFADSGSGTCASGTSFAARATCTVSATFSPKAAGTRNGGAVLTGSSGALIGSGYVTGQGVGPQLAFLPPVQATLGGSLDKPGAVAIDGLGNLYIADTNNNRVVKETLLQGGTYSQGTVASDLNEPRGVAVDGVGNVYIADSGNNRVLEETFANGVYVQSLIDDNGLTTPTGVAVDWAGNVYICDSGNNRVLMDTLAPGGYIRTTVASGLNKPYGLAVDGTGGVYIADTLGNKVLKSVLYSGVWQTEPFGSGFTLPYGVAVDGNGNLYVADSGNDRVVRVTLLAGNFIQNVVIASALNNPLGVAVDGNGNVYVADTDNNRALKESVGGPSLAFGTAPVGTQTASQIVTVTNLSSQAATFPAPASGSNPSLPPNFILESNATTCPVVKAGGAAGKLPGNDSCNLTYVFAPEQAGVLGGTSVLTDNNLNFNNAAQVITLSGSATKGSQTIHFPPPASPVVYSPGETVMLAATASSGLPVSYSVLSGPATVAGATLTLSGPGTIEVAASQAGNANYTAATSVAVTIEVTAFNTVIGGKTAAQPVLLQFTAAGTLSSIEVLTQGVSGLDFSAGTGGTCTTGKVYAVSQTCTVGVLFSPKYAGTRQGAVVLLNASNAPLATAYFQGAGQGPQLTFAPAQQSTIGNSVTMGLNLPNSVAVDGAGNLYIADTANSRVLKETLSAGVYTQSIIGSGLNRPGAVAVDAAGNVYIADSDNNRVLKETLSAGVYTQSIICSGIFFPEGVAVDAAGNVYIANTNNSQVLKETLSAGAYTQSSIGSGIQIPEGVAVDGVGNVYIADTFNDRVVKETLSGGAYTQSIIVSALNAPGGVAVDGVGNVYIADTFNNRLVKATPSNGAYTQSIVVTNGINLPRGVAVDGAGDVYVADTEDSQIVKATVATGPTLILASTVVGKISAPQAVTVTNLGNLPITFAVPTSGVNPSTGANFKLESNSDTTCPVVKAGGTAGTLAANTSCNLSYVFAPTHAGDLSSTSVLTDNSLNIANGTQTITLTGVANAQTITFPQPTSPVAYASGEKITLTATASSGLPVSYTVTSGPASVSGSILTLTGIGTVVVSANQAGNANYGPAAPVSSSVVVTTPSVVIGSVSSGQPVVVQFTAAGTLSSIEVLTQGVTGLDFSATTGGTCTTGKAYTVNQTCTVNVLFSPKYAGTRQGAVVLVNAGNASLATAYLQGTGMGSQLTFLPAMQSTIGSALYGPYGVAVDGAGSVYIADTYNDRVLKQAFSNGTYAQSIIAGGLYDPEGVAVDGAGNVYIADTNDNRVLKETLSGGTYTQSTVVAGLDAPQAVAVDAVGNVYVADTYNGRVLRETFSGGAYAQRIVASGLNNPASVAVDGIGNVYIADTNNNRVLKETLSGGGYIQSILVSQLGSPNGVAADGVGNIYIADTSNSRVLKEAWSGTAYRQSIVVSGLSLPDGLAVDGVGNVYVAENSTSLVLKENIASAPTLTFPATTPGTTSAAQAVTVTNFGNQPVTFAVPASGVNPSTGANFTLESNSDTTCPVVKAGGSAGTLATGSSCSLSYVFVAPAESGTVTSSSVLTDNNLHSSKATQSITLSGTSAEPITTISIP